MDFKTTSSGVTQFLGELPADDFYSNYKAGVTSSSVKEENDGTGNYHYTDITKAMGLNDNRWHCMHNMKKPGVSSFDYPVYEMTETSKHVGKKAAGWAIAEVAGRINQPKYGDFEITEKLGGNWLCLGGTVSYNGEFWQASRTYQHSPDGWDNDIYKERQVSK